MVCIKKKKFRRIVSSKPSNGSLVSDVRLLRSSVLTGEASSEAPLGPLLGQFQISLIDFCELFNSVSPLLFESDVELRLEINRYPNDYIVWLGFPRFSFFFFQFLEDYGFDLENNVYRNYCIFIEDIWFIVNVFSLVHKISVFNSSKIIFGYLSSSKFLVNFDN